MDRVDGRSVHADRDADHDMCGALGTSATRQVDRGGRDDGGEASYGKTNSCVSGRGGPSYGGAGFTQPPVEAHQHRALAILYGDHRLLLNSRGRTDFAVHLSHLQVNSFDNHCRWDLCSIV